MQILVPSKKLYYWVFLLSLLAIIVTANLVYIHYKPSGVGSVCNLNAYWNCDRVNQSTFAEFFGIPVAVLGLAFYLFFALNVFGIIKHFNYRRYYPINSTWLVRLTTFVTLLTILYFGINEYNLFIFNATLQTYAALKSFVLLLLTYLFFHRTKHASEIRKFIVFLSLLALLAFVFSLYLTHIELLVLEGICIFCLAQQILILMMMIFMFLAQFHHSKSIHG